MLNGPFGPSENPFVECPDVRALYPGRAHGAAVTCLRRAIEAREPFALLTGLPGVGKTVAVRAALADAVPHVLVSVTASPSLAPATLCEQVLAGLSPEASGTEASARPGDGIEARLRAVRAHGRRAVLVVDDAHDLALPVLEALQVLSSLEEGGRALLQIVLVGGPELAEMLSRPECSPLRQRNRVSCRLEPLSAEETEGYIRHRLARAGGESASLFTSESCRLIHGLTHGIPREIDQVAGEALMLARAAGEDVVAGNIATAVVLLGFRSVAEDVPPAPPAPDTVRPKAAEPAVNAAPTVALEESVADVTETVAPEPVEDGPVSVTPALTSDAEAALALLEDPKVRAWLEQCTDASGLPEIGPPPAAATTAPGASGPAPAGATGEPMAAPAPKHRRRGHGAVLAAQGRPSRHRAWSAAAWAAGGLLVLIAGSVVLLTAGRSLMGAGSRAPVVTESAPEPSVPAGTLSPAEARPSPVHATPAPAPASPTPVQPGPARPARAASAAAEVIRQPAPTKPVRSFGVEVADFIVEERAVQERDRLAARTSLPCRIRTSLEDGAEVYRVVVGPVASRQEAALLSEDLLERGLAARVRVVPWGAPGAARR